MSMPARDTPVRSCALGGQSCRSQSYCSLLDSVQFSGWHPRKCLTDTSTCRAIGGPHIQAWPRVFTLKLVLTTGKRSDGRSRDEATIAATGLLARTIVHTIVRNEASLDRS